MPNRILFDEWLSDKEKLFFCLISSLCAKHWYCRANNNYFAKKFNIDELTASRRISTLVKEWFIFVKIDKRQGNKRILSISPIDEKINTYWRKDQEGIDEKINTPIDEKINHNSIINNNINNNIKEKKAPPHFSFPDNTDEEEKNTFMEFVEMRKKIKKPATIRSQELLRKKLQELWKDPKERVKIVEQSIMWSRQTFYPLKTNDQYRWKEKLQWRVSTHWYADETVY